MYDEDAASTVAAFLLAALLFGGLLTGLLKLDGGW